MVYEHNKYRDIVWLDIKDLANLLSGAEIEVNSNLIIKNTEANNGKAEFRKEV